MIAIIQADADEFTDRGNRRCESDAVFEQRQGVHIDALQGSESRFERRGVDIVDHAREAAQLAARINDARSLLALRAVPENLYVTLLGRRRVVTWGTAAGGGACTARLEKRSGSV